MHNFIYLVVNKLKKKPDFISNEKMIEELEELIQALKNKDDANIIEEFSDVLFCGYAYLIKNKISLDYLNNIAVMKTKKRFPEELE